MVSANASSPSTSATPAVDENRIITVAQAAPAVRVTISEAFGLPPGAVSTGQLVTALKAVGFDYVFDTNVSSKVGRKRMPGQEDT